LGRLRTTNNESQLIVTRRRSRAKNEEVGTNTAYRRGFGWRSSILGESFQIECAKSLLSRSLLILGRAKSVTDKKGPLELRSGMERAYSADNPSLAAASPTTGTRKVPPLSLHKAKKREDEKGRGALTYSPRSQITPRSAASRSVSTGSVRPEEVVSREPTVPPSIPEARQSAFCSNIEVARKVNFKIEKYMCNNGLLLISFLQVLLNPKLQLVTQLSKRVEPADYSFIARTLVKIFEANLSATDLLEWAIRTGELCN